MKDEKMVKRLESRDCSAEGAEIQIRISDSPNAMTAFAEISTAVRNMNCRLRKSGGSGMSYEIGVYPTEMDENKETLKEKSPIRWSDDITALEPGALLALGQPSPIQFEIEISDGLSVALKAVREIKENYPDAEILVRVEVPKDFAPYDFEQINA